MHTKHSHSFDQNIFIFLFFFLNPTRTRFYTIKDNGTEYCTCSYTSLQHHSRANPACSHSNSSQTSQTASTCRNNNKIRWRAAGKVFRISESVSRHQISQLGMTKTCRSLSVAYIIIIKLSSPNQPNKRIYYNTDRNIWTYIWLN